MTEERLGDARALLDGGRWSFAYYVSGYALECALKSCLLARMVHTAWVFEERWRAQECLTHDYVELIRLSGLQGELNTQLAGSAAVGGEFVKHWGIALQWRVASRYESKTETEARDLFTAIIHDPDGVLPWLRKYW